MSKFLPGLHGLRALAALSVAVFHLAPNVQVPAELRFISTHFGLGVQLFFVLSAFSLAHSTFDRMSDPGWVRAFAIKRFFRIAPLFYTAMLFFTVYDYFVWGKIYTASEYIINGLFLHNFIPGAHESFVWAGWTIGVEMIFYGLFPIVLACVTTLRNAIIFFILSCAAGLAFSSLVAAVPGLPPGYGYMGFVRALPSFAAGLLAYQILRCAELRPALKRWLGPGAAAASFVAITAAIIVPWPKLTSLLWVLAFAALCLWQAAAPSRVMASRALTYIGERSFSIYLVHAVIVFRLTPIYLMLYAALPARVAFLASVTLGLSCVLIVASATYRLIEVPFIQLGSRLTRRSPPDPSREPSVAALEPVAFERRPVGA